MTTGKNDTRPKSQKEETEIYRILTFGVYQAYVEQDTAIQNSKIY